MSAATIINPTDARQLYNTFKNVKLAVWTNPNFAELLKDSKFADEIKKHKMSTDQLLTSITLMGKLSHQISEVEFVKFVQSNELPPIKLSAKDMESLKGGLIVLLFLLDVSIYAWAASRILNN